MCVFVFVHTDPAGEAMVKLEHRFKAMSLTPDDLPPQLKEGQFDITLFYSEDDRNEALTFKAIIEKYIKVGNQHATVCTIDQHLTWIQPVVGHLEEAIRRSSFAFLYVTDSFREGRWTELQKDECLMESIYNNDKAWFTVPVYTSRHQKHLRLTGLSGVKGIDLYRLVLHRMADLDADALNLKSSDFDTRYLESITTMISAALPKRLKREMEQREAISKWLDDKGKETSSNDSSLETELYKPRS